MHLLTRARKIPSYLTISSSYTCDSTQVCLTRLVSASVHSFPRAKREAVRSYKSGSGAEPWALARKPRWVSRDICDRNGNVRGAAFGCAGRGEWVCCFLGDGDGVLASNRWDECGCFRLCCTRTQYSGGAVTCFFTLDYQSQGWNWFPQR
jgi:hypothetical protein